MKKTKAIYWIFTGLFGAFMIFSALPDVMVVKDAVTLMTHLGYPMYFIPFIGIMKVLGVIEILIPGYPRIKEWAYAGLFFDLIGATFSAIAADGFMPQVLFMLLPMSLGALSYIYYHKTLHAR
jgi:hypothetical protein